MSSSAISSDIALLIFIVHLGKGKVSTIYLLIINIQLEKLTAVKQDRVLNVSEERV